MLRKLLALMALALAPSAANAQTVTLTFDPEDIELIGSVLVVDGTGPAFALPLDQLGPPLAISFPDLGFEVDVLTQGAATTLGVNNAGKLGSEATGTRGGLESIEQGGELVRESFSFFFSLPVVIDSLEVDSSSGDPLVLSTGGPIGTPEAVEVGSFGDGDAAVDAELAADQELFFANGNESLDLGPGLARLTFTVVPEAGSLGLAAVAALFASVAALRSAGRRHG